MSLTLPPPFEGIATLQDNFHAAARRYANTLKSDLMVAGELGDSGKELNEANSKLFGTFADIFLGEAAKGNFSILEEQEAWNFFIGDEIVAGVASSPLRETILHKFFDVTPSENALLRINVFAASFRSVLGSHFSSFVFSKVVEMITWSEAQMIPIEIRTYWNLEDLLIDTSLSSQEVKKLTQLLLTYRHLAQEDTPGDSLRRKILLKGSDEKPRPDQLKLLASSFEFDSLAYFVRIINPGFFNSWISKRGIDRRVAELLIDSWTGDFISFLDAAESLSAEKC